MDFAKGSITIVIAAIAVYIAIQQWKANERRLVLDRYDRRFRVYQRVMEFIALACRDFKPPYVEVQRFYRDVVDADFLFGAEYCDMTMVTTRAREMFSNPP